MCNFNLSLFELGSPLVLQLTQFSFLFLFLNSKYILSCQITKSLFLDNILVILWHFVLKFFFHIANCKINIKIICQAWFYHIDWLAFNHYDKIMGLKGYKYSKWEKKALKLNWDLLAWEIFSQKFTSYYFFLILAKKPSHNEIFNKISFSF